MKILSIILQDGGYYGYTFEDGVYLIFRALPGQEVDTMKLGEYRNYDDFVTSQQAKSPLEIFFEYPPRVIGLTYEACEEVHALTS